MIVGNRYVGMLPMSSGRVSRTTTLSDTSLTRAAEPVMPINLQSSSTAVTGAAGDEVVLCVGDLQRIVNNTTSLIARLIPGRTVYNALMGTLFVGVPRDAATALASSCCLRIATSRR